VNVRSFEQEPLPPEAVRTLIRRSRVLIWARISRDGTIRAVNEALARRTGIPTTELVGTPIFRILTEDDKDRLRERMEAAESSSPESFLANFVSLRHEVHTQWCRIFLQGDDLLLVGEPDVEEDRAVAEELLRLNNELSVLSRESARRSRELEVARSELEKTLIELETSHWHLRKIQENLPLCMRCGKMETGEARWESLLDYLRSNEIFVSHGYCPVCAEKVLAGEDG
jgi:PAS domain S-box-containing protein